MPGRIVLGEPPAPVTAAVADRPFQVRYVARNDGGDTTSGHWDHVAILDGTGMVQYEDWHKEGPLAPGEEYEAVVDVGIALEAGSYLVWVTLDGGGRRPARRSVPLAVESGSARSGSPRAAGAAPIRHRIEVDQPPAPLEQARVGAPFRLAYTAANAGAVASASHYDRLVIFGPADLWEGWNPVGPLEPGQRYDAVVDVPGLAAGDYRLEWTLDWAANHPMSVPGPADPAKVRGETAFEVEPLPAANSAR